MTNSICAWNPDMYGLDAKKRGLKPTIIHYLIFMHLWVWMLLK